MKTKEQVERENASRYRWNRITEEYDEIEPAKEYVMCEVHPNDTCMIEIDEGEEVFYDKYFNDINDDNLYNTCEDCHREYIETVEAFRKLDECTNDLLQKLDNYINKYAS